MRKILSLFALAAVLLSGVVSAQAQNSTTSDLNAVGAKGYVNAYEGSLGSSTSNYGCTVTVTKMPSSGAPGTLKITGTTSGYSYWLKDACIAGYVSDKNGRKFVVAQEGDSWGSIAFMLGMEEKTLRRINEATDKQPLRGGDRIYLFPKRSKAAKGNTRHLVQPGETAWDIAQYYGMKMSSLYKINGIPEGTPLTTQQWLRLR